MRPRTCTTESGVELTFRVVDDGKARRTIVLFGGLGGTHLVWTALVSRLRADNRVIMWDYPGFPGGGSLSRDVPVDIPALASYLKAVLDALDIERACLVGWSLGPQVALELERACPGVAGALVAICGVAGHPFVDNSEQEPIAAALGIRAAVPEAVGWLSRRLDSIERLRAVLGRLDHPTRWATRLGFVDPQVDELVFDAMIRDFLAMDPDTYSRYVRAAADHDAGDVVDTLTVPLLVVAGERDRLVPASRVRALATRAPGAEYLEVRGATHFLPLEYPDLLALTITDFLDRRYRG
jgi:pimeloyl-ACP methyl ester carboxylesterase